MADNYWNQFDKPASPGAAGGGSGADFWDQFDGPDRGLTGDVKAGLAHTGVSLRNMAGGAEKFVGRAADAAGDAFNSDMLHGIGSHLMQSGSDMQNAAAASENGSNTLGFEGQNSTLRRNAYGVADMGGQMAVVGGTGALAGAAAGAMFGGVGALPGAILGWGIANIAALPAMLGLSQASNTADKVEAKELADGKSASEAKHDALAAGAMTGGETALGAAAIGALGPVAKLVGRAATGAVVETALRATAKDVALDTAKATALGSAANVGQTAAIEGTEKAYGVGEGPTAQGLIDAGIQGAAITGLSHAPGAALRASSAGKYTGPLLDPQADPEARQKAALGAMAVIASRDPALAKDFGLYAQDRIANGLPIELGGSETVENADGKTTVKRGDDIYRAFARQQEQAKANADAGATRTTQDVSPTFVPTGDELAAANGPVQDNGIPAAQGRDHPDIVTPEGLPTAASSQPSWMTAAANPKMPAPKVEPVPQSAPPSMTESLSGIMHAGSVDEAIADTEKSVGVGIASTVDAVNKIGEAAGVITPEGAEATPSAENLATDRAFFADQADAAQRDMRQQAFDQAQAQPAPAVPADAFAAREAQAKAEAQAQRDAAHQQMQRDQLAQQADTAGQVSTATEAAAPPAEAPAMSRAMQGSLDRAAARMQGGKQVSTLDLGMLAQHHPDPAIQQQAATALELRKNRDIVQPAAEAPQGVRAAEAAEPIGGRPGVTTIDAAGAMRQGEPGAQFSPARGEVDPRVKALQDMADKGREKTADGQPVSIFHVDPATLPETRTAANNGVEGATTLSKSEAGLLQKAADIFGKKLVLFRQKGGVPPDGLILKSDAKTIYINADAASAHHLVVFGHELAHQMRTDAPKLFDAMRKAVLKEAGKGAQSEFMKYYLGRDIPPEEIKAALADKAAADVLTEEFVSDLVGNRFSEYRTWQQLFANAGKENRGLVYRIADYITKFIDHILANTSFRKFATDDMVNNLNGVRQTVRRALGDYSALQGDKAMAHEAEQMRARQANRTEATEPKKLVEPVANDRAFIGKAPSKAAPAAVPERAAPAVQGSREAEAMEPPKQFTKAAPKVETTEDDGLTVAGRLKAAQDAAAAAEAAKPEARTPVSERRVIEQPKVVSKPVEPPKKYGKAPEKTVLERSQDSGKPEAPAEAPKMAAPAATLNEAKAAESARRQAEIVAEIQAERQAAAEKRSSTAKERETVDPERDSLWTALSKLGGLNADEVKSQWGYEGSLGKSGQRNLPALFDGFRRLVTRNGMSLDRATEALHELGYLKGEDQHELEQRFREAEGGDHHYTDAGYANQHAADEAQRYAERDLKQQDIAESGYHEQPEEAQAAIQEYFNEPQVDTAADEAEAGRQRDADEARAEREQVERETDAYLLEQYNRRAGEQGEGVHRETGSVESDARAEGERDADTLESPARAGEEPGAGPHEVDWQNADFGLTPESQAEGEARLAREETDRAEKESAGRQADRKAEADAQRGDFKLTGSDREADANPDQDALFSTVRGKHLGDLNADEEAAVHRVLAVDDKSIKEKWKDYKTGLGKRLEQGVAHRYAALKDVSPLAHMQARLARGSDGALEAQLLYGKVFVHDDGAYDVKVNAKGGFANVLRKLGGEHNRFFLWIAAHRAEELTALEREHLFNGADIEVLKGLDRGREAKFAEALKDYQDYNKAILDIALKSGLIDEATRDEMASRMFVPFYRALKDQEGPAGPRNVSGLVNQYFSKKLKGGTEKLNDDLLSNVMQNWSHLLGAAARNRAARTAMEAGENLGIVEHLKHPEEASKNAIKVMVDGKTQFYEVHDPMLLGAVSAMYAQVPKWMKSLSTFKHALTFGVTAMPGFKVRNLIRDTVTSIAISPDISANPLENLRRGWAGTAHDSQTRASMLASGGIIRFGNLAKDGDAARTHRMVMAGVPRDSILDTPGRLKAFADTLRNKWDAYAELGDRSENMNRAALYERMIAEGHSHTEASFAARDLLDFSDGGTNPVVQFFVQSVPFLNARIQGLFKLGEAATKPETRKRFYAIAGTVVMASLANLLMYQDDKDFKAREDWDRDNYWWFKVGGEAFRIPKPFELGAIGTTAERMWELHSDPSMTGGRFAHVVGKMIGSQFNIDYRPQMVKPLSDVYSNRDSFTERPIENQSMQKMQPQDRYNVNTSMLARALGSLPFPEPQKLIVNSTFERLSPVQWDALLKGYFGGMGQFIIDLSDAAARPLTGQPSSGKPTFSFDNALQTVSMGFVKPLEGQQSRYMTDFYDQLTNIEQAHNSWRDAIKTGQPDKARQIMSENRQLISAYTMAESVKRSESTLNVMARRIQNSTSMDDDTKQARLQSIQEQRNQLAQRMSQRLAQRISQ